MTAPIVNRFLDYMHHELNRSARTVASYGSVLDEWVHFVCGDNTETFDAATVTVNDIRAFAAAQGRRGVSARTVKWKLSALRSFYTYLCRYHGLTSNPAADVALAKVPVRLPEFLVESETMAALDADMPDPSPADAVTPGNAPDAAADFTAVRNHLMVTMLYETGMRAAEMVGLEDSAVDTGRRVLRVLGKRNKERTIPIGDSLCAAIDRYRTLRADTVGTSATDTFFVRPDGQPIYYGLLNKAVHAVLDGRVNSARRSPHALRHSFATDMLNHGADINAVQRLMGHSSLATTQIYTHITYRELQNNYKLAHPRAQKTENHER